MAKSKQHKDYTPEDVKNIWLNAGNNPPTRGLQFDGAIFHEIVTFKEEDGHQYADSIEIEMDRFNRWRVKHYQERWMTKKDLITYYTKMLAVIKKM